MKMKLRIPYGISNFQSLRDEGYIYIDKTRYIEILEKEAPFQFFIRPRRFGKSLFISMLENYYDMNQAGKFDRLFGDFYIGQNPTPNKNSYLVLSLSFAGVVASEGKNRLIKSFDTIVIEKVSTFLYRYGKVLGTDRLPERIDGAEMAVHFMVEQAVRAGRKIFILIDEYDNFANEIISQDNTALYYDLLSSEGYVRAFYKAVKDGTSSCIARVFLTGVSPIMLDDLTSGFNITTNFTLKPKVHEMMGLNQQEVELCLQQLAAGVKVDQQKMREDLKTYYDGYIFSKKAHERLYNTDMVLYFIQSMLMEEEYPHEILDNNVKTDYHKLRQLAFNFRDEEVVNTLVKGDQLTTTLVERFNLEHIYKKRENFQSLLFYLGMLTIKEAFEDQVKLGIPNYVIKTIYWEYFFDKLDREVRVESQQLKDAVRSMRLEGDISFFIDYFSRYLQEISNRDLIQLEEKNIKAVLIVLFHFTGIYGIESEYETSAGYVDLLLVKDKRYESFTRYEWLMELKYLKEKDRKSLSRCRQDGITQVKAYAGTPQIRRRCAVETLKKVVVTVVGKKDVYLDMVE
jgi:hypothetical protein